MLIRNAGESPYTDGHKYAIAAGAELEVPDEVGERLARDYPGRLVPVVSEISGGASTEPAGSEGPHLVHGAESHQPPAETSESSDAPHAAGHEPAPQTEQPVTEPPSLDPQVSLTPPVETSAPSTSPPPPSPTPQIEPKGRRR